ncbi:MAG: hypothetical protein IGQ88_13175 [Gloeomargaritaceae cyanobacterium C42_A2020_066]|nr:hypothetical protein [Gloeomargaritaceae cyanobacterium C42_A2020_066]
MPPPEPQTLLDQRLDKLAAIVAHLVVASRDQQQRVDRLVSCLEDLRQTATQQQHSLDQLTQAFTEQARAIHQLTRLARDPYTTPSLWSTGRPNLPND